MEVLTMEGGVFCRELSRRKFVGIWSCGPGICSFQLGRLFFWNKSVWKSQGGDLDEKVWGFSLKGVE